MASLSPERRVLRARIAANQRHYPDKPELVEDDQRALKAARVEEFITRAVSESPPLTSAQRAHLASLLRGDGGGTDGA